jgi:hypothetical protein
MRFSICVTAVVKHLNDRHASRRQIVEVFSCMTNNRAPLLVMDKVE